MKKRPICQMAAAMVIGLLSEYMSIPKSQLMNVFPQIPWEVFHWLFLLLVMVVVVSVNFYRTGTFKIKAGVFTKTILLVGCFLLGQTVMREASTNYLPEPIEEGSSVTVTGRVKRYEIKNNQIYYYLRTKAMYHDVMIMVPMQETTSQSDNQQISVGMTVEATGTLSLFPKATNEGQFDQQLYYKSQNLDFSVRKAEVIILEKKTNDLGERLQRLQIYLSNEIQKLAGEKYGGILAAMLFGDKTSMDQEDKKLYQRQGIAHVMSISGLHISILGLGLYKLLDRCRCPRWLSATIGGVFVVLFGMLTGMSVSTFRAVIMYLLTMAARLLGRTYDMPTAVSLAAMLVLLERPYALFQSGMQFSFGAIFALVLYDKLKREGFGKWFFKKIPKVFEGFFVSMHIQLVTLPVQLYHTFYFSVCSSLLNLFVIPTMSLVLSLGMLATLASVLLKSTFPQVSGFLIFPCKCILWLYEVLCRLAENIPGAVQVFGRPTWWQLMVYYLLLALFCLCLMKFKKPHGSFLFPVLMIGLLCPIPLSQGKITMLDVGQGECICIQLPNNKVILSDGGSTDVSNVGTYRIKSFLLANGISTVDAVFISHWDEDHISGIEELLTEEPREIQIKTMVLPKTETEEEDEKLRTLLEEAKQAGVWVQYVKAGDACTFGEASFTCLWPKEGLVTEERNDCSAVFHMSYGQFQMLLTGDLSETYEEELIGKSKYCQVYCDVLKVAHHGSQYSTSEAFLKEVRPSLALISCGENNSYGHPHQELLQRLEKAGCKIHTTVECGAITLLVEKEIKVQCFTPLH